MPGIVGNNYAQSAVLFWLFLSSILFCSLCNYYWFKFKFFKSKQLNQREQEKSVTNNGSWHAVAYQMSAVYFIDLNVFFLLFNRKKIKKRNDDLKERRKKRRERVIAQISLDVGCCFYFIRFMLRQYLLTHVYK